MKNRLKALLLAAGLTALTAAPYAAASAPAKAEELTEAAELASEAAEQLSEAAQGMAEEPGSEAAALAQSGPVSGEGQYAAYYDQMKTSVAATLENLSAMTDEQLQSVVEGTDAASAAIAAGWLNVKEELGAFVSAREQTITEGDNKVTVVTDAEYDGVSDKTKVKVVTVYDMKKSSMSMEWDVKYPMGKLMREAGLNTLLGMGTVFIVLIFLSFVIANIHWIPDLVEKGRKKPQTQEPVREEAPAPQVIPAAEEELTDDMELVSVISAAIAAFQDVPADGFVVRSIRKANRRR